MSNNYHFMHLAYLIELSVVLNLAYREIKYIQTGEKLQRKIESIQKELKRKEIDVNKDEPIYDRYQTLCNIIEGDKKAWQDHRFRSNFYKFLKSGWSTKFVSFLIGYCLVLLSLFTYMDANQIPFVSYEVFIWQFSYWTVLMSLIIPIFLLSWPQDVIIIFSAQIHQKMGE